MMQSAGIQDELAKSPAGWAAEMKDMNELSHELLVNSKHVQPEVQNWVNDVFVLKSLNTDCITVFVIHSGETQTFIKKQKCH